MKVEILCLLAPNQLITEMAVEVIWQRILPNYPQVSEQNLLNLDIYDKLIPLFKVADYLKMEKLCFDILNTSQRLTSTLAI